MNIYDYCTWKFSLTRWGVTDFGMTTTFLSMWNLIRTWGYGSNKQWSFSSVLFNFPMIQIFFLISLLIHHMTVLIFFLLTSVI